MVQRKNQPLMLEKWSQVLDGNQDFMTLYFAT